MAPNSSNIYWNKSSETWVITLTDNFHSLFKNLSKVLNLFALMSHLKYEYKIFFCFEWDYQMNSEKWSECNLAGVRKVGGEPSVGATEVSARAWVSHPQYSEEINLCCLSHLVPGILMQSLYGLTQSSSPSKYEPSRKKSHQDKLSQDATKFFKKCWGKGEEQ